MRSCRTTRSLDLVFVAIEDLPLLASGPLAGLELDDLASASSQDKEIGSGNRDGAKQVGELLAKRAAEKGVKQVVFDRGG
ncbi:MAG: hypothetical protein K8H99_00925, partial [Nitrospirae bacterium]|nr:hypothetical protein [Fimbriimonadaceae bacterium]